MRTGPLRNHVDSLSRVALALRIRLPEAAASEVLGRPPLPAVMATVTDALRNGTRSITGRAQ